MGRPWLRLDSRQFAPAGGVFRRTMFTPHTPAFCDHPGGGGTQSACAHFSIDLVKSGHQPIITWVVSGIKQSALNFPKRKVPQHDTGFFVVEALTPREARQAHGFTKNDGRGRGGGEKRGRASPVVLGQIVSKPVGGQKDRNLSGGSSFVA